MTGYNDNGKAIAPLWSADNVDVQKATLTGSGTFHGTGIILSLISKGSFSANVIRRRKVTKDEILEQMVVIKTYPRDKEKTIKDLALKGSGIATMSTKETKSNGLIDYLRVTSGKESTPQISGVMHVVTRGNEIPGKHTIAFLPSTDWSCMYTTLDFIISLHKDL